MLNTYQVFWTVSAEEDLRTIIEYIFTENPIAAKESLQKLKNKASSLEAFPQKGRIVPELKAHGILQYRELIISPWRLIYRISQEQVTVLTVIDSRRNVEDILFERLIRNATL